MTTAKNPAKRQSEDKSVLSGKPELEGTAEEKLRHMGEMTRAAARESEQKQRQSSGKSQS
jgi:hypothetical protein